jgi:hypothetical protein
MKLFKSESRMKKAMDVINAHCGKKRVYQMYLKKNPKLAEKYVSFIAKNNDATYIYWDEDRQAFAG